MSNNAPLSFAALLKSRRRELGLSQEQLAAKAGYTPVYVSMLERGVRAPIAATAELLAQPLNLTLEERAEFLKAASVALEQQQQQRAKERGRRGGALSAAPQESIVAREFELAALMTALSSAQSGNGSLIALSGEPGVGKSQLGLALIERARTYGALTAVGHCREREQKVAYSPFSEAFGQIEASLEPPLRANARERWPFLYRLLPGPSAEAPLTPESLAMDNPKVFWRQTLGFLQTAAASRPIVFLLEDLHWADQASLELLDYLTENENIARLPMLLVITYRNTELYARTTFRHRLRALRLRHAMKEITIPRMTAQESATLAAVELGAAISPDLGAQLQRATEGNPFFILELLRLLRQRDGLTCENGVWRRNESRAFDVPDEVRDAISERMERLSAHAQATLEAASVLGQTFSHSTLNQMRAYLPDELNMFGQGLEEAFDAGFIYETPQNERLEVSYSFSHALAQRAIYTQMIAPRRRRLHNAAGSALQETAPHLQSALAAVITYHFLEGSAIESAAPFALEACDYAMRLCAWTEVERHTDIAVKLSRILNNADAEAEALVKRATAISMLGRFDEAITIFEQANAIYRKMGRLDQLAWTTAFMTRTRMNTARAREGYAQLQAVLMTLATHGNAESAQRQDSNQSASSLAEPTEPEQPLSIEVMLARAAQAATVMKPQTAAQVYLSLTVYWLLLLQDVEGAIIFGELAVQRARAVGDTRILLRALAFYGLALASEQRLSQAAVVYEEARVIAGEANDPEALTLAASNLSDIYRVRGEFTKAEQLMAVAQAASERSGIPDMIAQSWIGSSLMAFWAGRWGEAQRMYERAEEVAQEYHAIDPFDVRTLKGIFLLLQGQSEQAHKLLEQAAVVAAGAENWLFFRNIQQTLAEEELVSGQFNAARQRLEPLLKLPAQNVPEALELIPNLAWAMSGAGDLERAVTLINECIALARLQERNFNLTDALRVKALIAIQQQCWRDAEEALDEAIALAKPMPYPYAVARALYVYGRYHQQRNEREQARQRYHEALTILNRLGERLYALRVEQALAALDA